MKNMNSVAAIPMHNSITHKYDKKITENNSNNFNSNTVTSKYYKDLCDSVSYRLTYNSDNLEYTSDYKSARNLINEIKTFFENRDFQLVSSSYDDTEDLTVYIYNATIAGVNIKAEIRLDESDWDNESSKITINITANSI